MRKLLLMLMAVMAVSWGVGAEASLIEGREWAVNIDGSYTLTSGQLLALPGNAVVPILTPGTHYVGLFIDYDIDVDINPFFNEFGAANGAPAAGLSWEIDEPEYLFGDIKTNLKNGALDNANGVPASAPDDVSMALAWNFSLAAGETADVIFHLSTVAPASGFYLSQTDPDSAAAFYFWSDLVIGGGQVPVPEPATLLLMGSGLGGLALLRKWRKG